MSHIFRNTQGPENVTRLQTGGGAGRPAGDGYVFQSHKQTFPLHISEGDIEIAWISVEQISVEFDFFYFVGDPGLDILAEKANVLGIVGHLLLGQTTSLSEAGDQGGGQSAGAQTFLLSAAVYQRTESHSRLPPHEQGPYSFGSVQLMSTDAQQVHSHRIHVYRDFARGLGSVCVEQHVVGLADSADRLQILYHSDLVINMNHRQ